MRTLTHLIWVVSLLLASWLLIWAVTGHWLTAALAVVFGYTVLRLSKQLLISLFRRPIRRAIRRLALRDSRYPRNWDQIRRRVYRRDRYTCQNCGATGVRIEAHHVVPIRFGGSHHLSNLISLCAGCHAKADGKRLRGG